MRTFCDRALVAVPLLAMAWLCGCNPVPSEIRAHAAEYLQSPAAVLAADLLNDPSAFQLFSSQYVGDRLSRDYDGYVSGRIAPVDVTRRAIDPDTYKALPESLRARTDADVGTLVLTRWQPEPRREEYRGPGGKTVMMAVGRGAGVVVIDRAKDSIVSAFNIYASGPDIMSETDSREGKLTHPLEEILTKFASRGAVPFPRRVEVRGVLLGAPVNYEVFRWPEVARRNRVTKLVAVVKWAGSDRMTLDQYPDQFAPRQSYGDDDEEFRIEVDRDFAERTWKGGYGEYAVVEVKNRTEFWQERPLRIVARFRIEPGQDRVILDSVLR